jgi:hypothetical protein
MGRSSVIGLLSRLSSPDQATLPNKGMQLAALQFKGALGRAKA